MNEEIESHHLFATLKRAGELERTSQNVVKKRKSKIT